MRALSFFTLSLFLFTSCGFQHPVQTALHSYKKQTPPEYYAQAHPASYSPGEGSLIPMKNSATETDSQQGETKGERHTVAIIGTLAGLMVVAGVVTPIVLLHK
jgi:hypothetical protein